MNLKNEKVCNDLKILFHFLFKSKKAFDFERKIIYNNPYYLI